MFSHVHEDKYLPHHHKTNTNKNTHKKTKRRLPHHHKTNTYPTTNLPLAARVNPWTAEEAALEKEAQAQGRQEEEAEEKAGGNGFHAARQDLPVSAPALHVCQWNARERQREREQLCECQEWERDRERESRCVYVYVSPALHTGMDR